MGKKRILITGAAGNLGVEFVRQFCQIYDIVGTDIKPTDLYPSNVPFVVADIAKPEDNARLFLEAKAILGGIDVFVHCGAVAAPGKDQILTFEVNARGTFYLLQECVKHQIQHVVLATSGWVQGLPSPEIKPRKLPIDEQTVGHYKDVYHISKKFNEENGKMHVCNGQIRKLISLRFGGIININKDGLKALSTEPYWTRLPVEDAAVALDCAVNLSKEGFHYFLIGSKNRYNDEGKLETRSELEQKLLKHGYQDLLGYLDCHFEGKQTFDLRKSFNDLGFKPRW